MAYPTPYFDLIREMKDAFNHRLRLVDCARPNGIKAAARFCQTTAPTVRKRVRGYRQQGLKDLPQAPHGFPHKVRVQNEGLVEDLLSIVLDKIVGKRSCVKYERDEDQDGPRLVGAFRQPLVPVIEHRSAPYLREHAALSASQTSPTQSPLFMG